LSCGYGSRLLRISAFRVPERRVERGLLLRTKPDIVFVDENVTP
jgi:hypothetical protein